MDAIVAVYDDWGIGANGTQPVALTADRKFFRSVTKGATVIVGRKTMLDFPGGRPLPNRRNIVLTRQELQIEGASLCSARYYVIDNERLLSWAPNAHAIEPNSVILIEW